MRNVRKPLSRKEILTPSFMICRHSPRALMLPTSTEEETTTFSFRPAVSEGGRKKASRSRSIVEDDWHKFKDLVLPGEGKDGNEWRKVRNTGKGVITTRHFRAHQGQFKKGVKPVCLWRNWSLTRFRTRDYSRWGEISYGRGLFPWWVKTRPFSEAKG